jgi:hypothetical protein
MTLATSPLNPKDSEYYLSSKVLNIMGSVFCIGWSCLCLMVLHGWYRVSV